MKITLDPDYYTRAAIDNMSEQFSEYMLIDIHFAEAFILTMRVNDSYLSETSTIINTFLNNIIELSIQEVVTYEG